jgi:hypothetical protein
MPSPRSSLFAALPALALVVALSACDGKIDPAPVAPTPPAAQGVAVEVSPPTQTIATGASARLAAAVTGTSDGRVTWSIDEAAGGTVDPTGIYTAPATAGAYHVRATSVVDTRAYGEAVVTVVVPSAVAVSLTPSPATVYACQTVQFTPHVTNATNAAVTWSIQEGTAGGAVSATGLYTAPSTPGTYHVVATSVQDPTRTAVVAVTVSQHVLSVAVSPASVTLSPGQSQQFSATVTTTCGATVTTSTVTAPL